MTGYPRRLGQENRGRKRGNRGKRRENHLQNRRNLTENLGGSAVSLRNPRERPINHAEPIP